MRVGNLSGGNQQKLLFAKTMLSSPDIVIIDEPTRGIDIGTKQQMYGFIRGLADQPERSNPAADHRSRCGLAARKQTGGLTPASREETAMKHLVSGLALSVALAVPAIAQETKVIGVSIPAATHGWAAGMNYFAQAAIDRLEETYPELDFVLATASDPGKQVSDIEDMVATRNIDALVVLPFESEPLTGPVQNVKASGAWITVVDRGLSVPGIEDLYVAGDNPGFGRVSGEYMASAMPDGGRSSCCAASRPP